MVKKTEQWLEQSEYDMDMLQMLELTHFSFLIDMRHTKKIKKR